VLDSNLKHTIAVLFEWGDLFSDRRHESQVSTTLILVVINFTVVLYILLKDINMNTFRNV
jgi:hypothetical protein